MEKVFDYESYQKVDGSSREFTKKVLYLQNPNHTIETNPDRYGVDLIVKYGDKAVAYIEVDNNKKWINKLPDRDYILLFERKEHFLYGKDACGHTTCKKAAPFSCKELPYGPLPIFFSTVNHNFTSLLLYKATDALECPRETLYANRGEELVRKIPVRSCFCYIS